MQLLRLRILFLSLVLVPALYVHAGVITATVTSKTEASVGGDESGRIGATYSTTGSTKDRLTAGAQATMTLTDLPNGTIDYIAVYMHSNKSSGIGTLSLKMNSVQIASVADKKFCEWPGQTDFVTDYVPVWFYGPWEIEDGSTLSLQISASANSLYFSGIEVSLTEGAPSPCTVTFSWNTEDGDKQTTKTEKSVGAGIELPSCELKSFMLEGEEWRFAGWCRDRVVAHMKSEPALLYAEKVFYPSRNCTLYAVYKTVNSAAPVMQDTLYESGLFAMVMRSGDGYNMASGDVKEKQIATKPCSVEMQTDGRYQLLQDYVSAEARYWVEFDEQMLTITNALTDATIGHTTTDLAANSASWNWRKGINHSVAIYCSPKEKDGVVSAQLLMIPMLDWGVNNLMTYNVKLQENFEYILLFDVIDVPTSASSTIWTSHPFGYDALRAPVVEQRANKIVRNGVLLIERDGVLYDMCGRQYRN